MSHSATTSPTWPAWSVSLLPLPPTPMQAMFSRSSGERSFLSVSAAVADPATQNPRPATAPACKNPRRSVCELIPMPPSCVWRGKNWYGV